MSISTTAIKILRSILFLPNEPHMDGFDMETRRQFWLVIAPAVLFLGILITLASSIAC